MCPAVRRLVTHNPLQGWRKGYAFHGNLFAWRFGVHGNVQLDRCHGRTILHARGGDGVCRGQPLHFNLRGGLFLCDGPSALPATFAQFFPASESAIAVISTLSSSS
jgi:hypothetical protein